MFRNVASQKCAVFAWDQSSGVAKTGDAAQISAQISKDGGACAATNDAVPTELDSVDAPGIYIFDMHQDETNADLVVITPVSSTTDIVLRPVIIYTQTVMRGTDSANTTVPDAAGVVPTLAEILAGEVDNDGTAISLAGALKLALAVLTGKSSGGGTATLVFRDINDSKDRISATVDVDGNRTAVGTRDAS